MTMRKMSFALAGLMLAALSVPPTLAQEAADASPGAMLQVAEEALGISDPADAPDTTPDPATFAAVASMLAPMPGPALNAYAGMQVGPAPSLDAAPVSVEVADRGGPPGKGGEGGPGRHHGGGFGGALHGPLALSDDQFERLYSIKNATTDQAGPKKLELHTSFRNLMDALAAPNQDTGRIKSLQDRIASLKSDLSTLETGKLVQMSQVLTADQRSAIHIAMIRRSLGGHHHGGHGHGGPGARPGMHPG